MRRGEGERAPRGRYACGCHLERSYGAHGGVRIVPACARHGEGLAMRTAFSRAAVRAIRGTTRRWLSPIRRAASSSAGPRREVERVQILGHVLGDVQL